MRDVLSRAALIGREFDLPTLRAGGVEVDHLAGVEHLLVLIGRPDDQ